MKLILFPGLACDERLFASQKESLKDIADVIVPEWVEPQRSEDLKTFALRWAEEVYGNYFDGKDGAGEKTCYIGGLSFGGMVVPYIGNYLIQRGVDVRGCFLLASVRGGTELPPVSRFFWKASLLLPCGGWRLIRIWVKMLIWILGNKNPPFTEQVLSPIADSPVRRNYDVLRMICSWQDAPAEYPFPIWHLHGSADKQLPVRYTHPDEIINGAGHIIALTRSKEVNQFIRDRISVE